MAPSTLCSDALGSVVASVDSVGTVDRRSAYQAYGTPDQLASDFTTALASDDWEFRFAGYQYESHSGLYPVRWRYLNSALGVWTARDPVVPIDAPYLCYLYVLGNPIYFNDPMGLWQESEKQCCCCCVDNLTIPEGKVERFSGEIPGLPPEAGVRFGISFDVVIDTSWVELPKKEGCEPKDCKFEWWERSSTGLPVFKQKPNTWYDQFADHSDLLMFKPWRDRKKTCPGKEATTITDKPSLGPLGKIDKASMKLLIAIRASSAPGCECAEKSKVVLLDIFISIKGGAGDKRIINLIDKLPGAIKPPWKE